MERSQSHLGSNILLLPDHGSLTVDVSCGCPSPCHCGSLILGVLSIRVTWPLTRIWIWQMLGLESLTSCTLHTTFLLHSPGEFLPEGLWRCTLHLVSVDSVFLSHKPWYRRKHRKESTDCPFHVSVFALRSISSIFSLGSNSLFRSFLRLGDPPPSFSPPSYYFPDSRSF